MRSLSSYISVTKSHHCVIISDLGMLLICLSDDSFIRMEHESLCGDGCGSTSDLGSLGWCKPASITIEALDSCFWRSTGHAS